MTEAEAKPDPLVAVVEDDAAIAEGLALNLNLQGYRTTVVEDGEAAYQVIKDDHPDLVLLDISLPKQSGLWVLERLRKDDNNVPVIVLSARQNEFDKVAALQLGADDYVTKPIDFDVLDTIIGARLAGVARNDLWPKLIDLNDREVETLTWAARGKTSSEIAQILGLAKRTVDFHIDNARTKLGAATRVEAAIKAATGRLIEP
jgi:DNA-binding response OmpR family regulator